MVLNGLNARPFLSLSKTTDFQFWIPRWRLPPSSSVPSLVSLSIYWWQILPSPPKSQLAQGWGWDERSLAQRETYGDQRGPWLLLSLFKHFPSVNRSLTCCLQALVSSELLQAVCESICVSGSAGIVHKWIGIENITYCFSKVYRLIKFKFTFKDKFKALHTLQV